MKTLFRTLICSVSILAALGLAQYSKAQVAGLTLTPNHVIGKTTATGTVTAKNAAPSGGLTIKLASSSTVATVPTQVVVPSGATKVTFAINTENPPSTVTAAISGTDPLNQKVTANLVIDPVVNVKSIALAPSTVVGGKSSVGTIELKEKAGSTGLLLKLTSAKTFAKVPSTVTVKAGGLSATFTITTTQVNAADSATITATDPSKGSASASLTVNPPVPTIASFTLTPASVPGGKGSSAKIVLSRKAPSTGFTIKLASNQSFAKVPTSVGVAAGSTSTTFSISTATVTQDSVATISATDAASNRTNSSLTVLAPPPAVSSLLLNPTAVTAGAASTATIKLSKKAGTAGIVISLSSNQTYAPIPATVTLTSGTDTATFKIATLSSAPTGTATITAKDPSGNAVLAKLAVTASSTTTVKMNGHNFIPQTTTVAAGSTIEFTNVDSFIPHTVTPDVATAGMDSGTKFPNGLPGGAVFDWTVPSDAKSGTKFFYHCKFHGSAGDGKSLGFGMAGVIVVK